MSNKQKTIAILGGIGAIAFVIATLLTQVVSGNSSGPTATVVSFIDATKDEDCEKVVNLVDYSALERQGQAINMDEIIKNCKDSPEFDEIVGYKVMDEKVNGDNAVVNVEVTTKDNGKEKTETIPFSLKKINSDWKIYSNFP